MADDTQDGPPDIPDDLHAHQAERRRLFEEISELRSQRNELQTLLAQCRSENSALRAQIRRDET